MNEEHDELRRPNATGVQSIRTVQLPVDDEWWNGHAAHSVQLSDSEKHSISILT